MKANDDFGNALMMLFHDNAVQAAPLTTEERQEEKMPKSLQLATIAELPPEDVGRATMAHDIYLSRIRLAEQERTKKKHTPTLYKPLFTGRRG
jgi:hypothetical protein